MNRLTSIFSTLLILIVAIEATSPLDVDIGLYHASSKQVGVNCTTIKLPWNFCPACKLKSFKGSGADLDFGGVNRFDIFDLDDMQCRNMIRRYLVNNPCDTTRKQAFDNYEKNNSPDAYKVLIYFMYSACETCCDCIPIGSRVEDYEFQKKNNNLTHIYRGNCAAHFYYDTCRIWPQVGQIIGLNGTPKNLPTWCPDFKNWQFSNDSKGWLKNNDVNGVTWKMSRAMNMLMRQARCGEETLWKNCVGMESAQGRV